MTCKIDLFRRSAIASTPVLKKLPMKMEFSKNQEYHSWIDQAWIRQEETAETHTCSLCMQWERGATHTLPTRARKPFIKPKPVRCKNIITRMGLFLFVTTPSPQMHLLNLASYTLKDNPLYILYSIMRSIQNVEKVSGTFSTQTINSKDDIITSKGGKGIVPLIISSKHRSFREDLMKKKKRSKRAHIRQRGGGILSQRIKELCQDAKLQAHDLHRPVHEICNRLNAVLQKGKPHDANGSLVEIKRIVPSLTERKKKRIKVYYMCNGESGQITLLQRDMVSLL